MKRQCHEWLPWACLALLCFEALFHGASEKAEREENAKAAVVTMGDESPPPEYVQAVGQPAR